MLSSLRSCYPLRTTILSRNVLKPTTFSHFSFSGNQFFHKSKTLSCSINPKRKMSSRPSAFDALMSGARAAAAAKKKPQSTSSPKKRKTLDSTLNPKTTNTSAAEKILEIGEGPSKDLEKPISNQIDQPRDSEKIPKPTSSSPKKRKTVETKNPKTGTSSVAEKIREDSEETSIDLRKSISNESIKSQDSVEVKLVRESVNAGEKPGKKVNIAELKSKIVLLKKKAGEFDPKMVACWEKGERVPFIFLSLVFDTISNETGRIVITDIVCNMLRTVMETAPEDLVPVVYLAANKIAPSHEGLELGIGDASIIKALAEACGRTETQVKKQYKEMGDLGLVAKVSRSSQSMMRKPDSLTITKVFDTFRLIAKEVGKDSQEKKKNRIKALLVAATDCEPQYLIRLLQSKLRIGLAEQTLLAALGQAAVYNEQHSKPPPNIQSPLEEAAKIVKQVYSVLPVYDMIVAALLNDGVWNLPNTCSFTPGIPVGPMLAKPTKGVSEIVNKFQDMEYTCEYKYDGERAQIHYMEDGSVEIYSRNAERNTGKFPDVILAVSRLKKPSVTSFVLDCELVAYEREKQKILPFQILSTRARKNVSVGDIKVDVCIYAFDILYRNGQPLLQEQLKVRREVKID